MSTETAIRAERDLNSYYAKQGVGRKGDSSMWSSTTVSPE